MRISLLVIALCSIASIAIGQCEVNYCSPTGVCPPTGNLMGQSNYQRSTHYELMPQSAAPTRIEKPITLPPKVGAGPLVDATPAERRNIAVDDQYIYVLQGDEVVKLDKRDLKTVARVKLAPGE